MEGEEDRERENRTYSSKIFREPAFEFGQKLFPGLLRFRNERDDRAMDMRYTKEEKASIVSQGTPQSEAQQRRGTALRVVTTWHRSSKDNLERS
jgi:hypothetical protein